MIDYIFQMHQSSAWMNYKEYCPIFLGMLAWPYWESSNDWLIISPRLYNPTDRGFSQSIMHQSQQSDLELNFMNNSRYDTVVLFWRIHDWFVRIRVFNIALPAPIHAFQKLMPIKLIELKHNLQIKTKGNADEKSKWSSSSRDEENHQDWASWKKHGFLGQG